MEPTAMAAWEAARQGHGLPFTTACVAPWVSLELDPAGWAYACCANQTYPLGRIDEARLPELWGGERMQVLRDSLRRWDLSVGCQSCRWHFEHGRMDPDAAVYEHYPISDPEPAGPVAMTFALSNRCNLGCVMCNPALSSVLRHQAALPPLIPPYGDEFFDDLVAFLPGLRYAKFLGGEPFLIPEHHRVWQLMDEVGGPPRIQVTTNATLWNDRIEWLLERFVVDITVSIDGTTAATYEAIRRGATFADVHANVERFRAACARSGAQLRFCFCLMDRNWHELGAFLSWADELDVPVSVNLVSDDGFALHDLALDRLDHIAAAWAAEGPQLEATLALNLDVWRTQVTQLEVVRAERRAGVLPASKQPKPVAPGFFAELRRGPAPAPVPPDVASEAVAAHRLRLERWSGGGPVAVLDVGPERTVRRVIDPHPRLGLEAPAIIGLDLDALVDVIGRADGRPTWVLDVEAFPDHVVRMIGLSTNPVRGNPGCMVRTIEVHTDGGPVVLVAEDRLLDHIHERSNVVPIPAPVRRAGGTS